MGRLVTDLDLAFVRSQFPAFTAPALAGWSFFENAGGSFPCRQVVDRLTDFYTQTKVQPHHPYPAARRAGEAMDAGPTRLAAWLGVGVEDVHVGPSTTQNTYVLAQAFRGILSPGDAVVVTDQDHEANSGAWRRLADAGIEVREWGADPDTGTLHAADLDDLLDDRVRLVSFPHCSNVLGEPNPVRELCERIRSAGALSVVDGVAHAPHALPDVPALGADIYLFSTYKTYGPHQGVMVMSRELAEQLPNQGHFFNEGVIGKRLVPAGPDHAQVAALAGIVDYLEAVDRHHFGDDVPATQRMTRVAALWHEHEQRLLEPLMAALTGREDVRVLGPTQAAARVPTVSIVGTRPGAELAAALAEHRVMAGGGHFYAYRLLRAMGVDPSHGVLRVSFVHNTSDADVERLVDALDAVL